MHIRKFWSISCAAILMATLLSCSESNPASEDPDLDPEEPETAEIHTRIEGGNLADWEFTDDVTADVTIRLDTNSPEYRWYSFILKGGAQKEFTVNITNAGGSNASAAWAYNQPAISRNGGQDWSRIVQTAYEGDVFSFTFTQSSDSAWIAYQPVYNFSRWLALADEFASLSSAISVTQIGESRDGNPLHLVRITDPTVSDDEKSAVWVVARQHPAEVGGSYMAEGLMRWAAGIGQEAVSFRQKSILFVIPFMNPDGVIRGNYRMNQAGLNLNREWDSPDPERAPTVSAAEAAVLDFQSNGGEIQFFADFHAHSTLRKNFFYYANTAASNPEMLAEMEGFMQTLNTLNPDFTVNGSEPSFPSNPGIAWAWASTVLGIHAITFESSYQDITYGPNAGSYMTVERWISLGEAFGEAMETSIYFEP